MIERRLAVRGVFEATLKLFSPLFPHLSLLLALGLDESRHAVKLFASQYTAELFLVVGKDLTALPVQANKLLSQMQREVPIKVVCIIKFVKLLSELVRAGE